MIIPTKAATAILLALFVNTNAKANPSIISKIVEKEDDFTTTADTKRIRTGGEAKFPIPSEGTSGPLTIELTVRDPELLGCLIDDINVEIGLEHPWAGDLDVALCSPEETCVALFTDIGSSTALDSRKTIVLDDEASQNIRDAIFDSNPVGTPENGSLGDFDGEGVLGVWTLAFVDDSPGDSGFFYSLYFDIACNKAEESQEPSLEPTLSPARGPSTRSPTTRTPTTRNPTTRSPTTRSPTTRTPTTRSPTTHRPTSRNPTTRGHTSSPPTSSPTSQPTSSQTVSPTTQPSTSPVKSSGPQPAWSLISNTGSPSQCLILEDRPNCIKSSDAPPYESNVLCVFEALEDGELSVEFWDVEEGFDGFFLNVERSLRDTEDEMSGLVMSRGDTLTWVSDRLGVQDGWLICLSGPTKSPTISPSGRPTISPTTAPSQNPTTSPTGAPTEEVVLTTAVCPLCFMPVPMTWTKAQSTAQEYSCALASIETIDDVLQASLDFSSHMIDEKYWVGGYQSNSDLLWYWADGAPFSGSRWAPGEPNGISEEGVGGLTNYTAIGGHETGGGLVSLFDESGEADLRSIWKCCSGCPSLDITELLA